MQKRKEFTRETFVRKFFKDNQLPFPVQREEFIPYYATVEHYENLVDSFNDYIEHVTQKGFESYIEDKDCLEEILLSVIKRHPKYQEFIASDISKSNFKHPKTKYHMLYNERLSNNYFLSIDMNNANFYMLFLLGIVETPDYKEWVRKFTSDESIIQSKQLRQILLGQLNSKRLERRMSEELFLGLEKAHLGNLLNKDNLVIVNKDELVFIVNDLEDTKELLESKKLEAIFHNCSFDLFYLDKTEYGYVKEYLDGSYSFHTVPSKYWMLNYKKYKGLEVEEKDLMFLDENRNLCKMLEYGKKD